MAREQTKPGDPEYGLFVEVLKWNNTIECIPSWEEILEYEYVRQKGEINMVTADLQRYAFDRGLYALVTWIQRCKDARIAIWSLYDPAMKAFESEHGPREKWITDDLSDELEARAVARERSTSYTTSREPEEASRCNSATRRGKVKPQWNSSSHRPSPPTS